MSLEIWCGNLVCILSYDFFKLRIFAAFCYKNVLKKTLLPSMHHSDNLTCYGYHEYVDSLFMHLIYAPEDKFGPCHICLCCCLQNRLYTEQKTRSKTDHHYMCMYE